MIPNDIIPKNDSPIKTADTHSNNILKFVMIYLLIFIIDRIDKLKFILICRYYNLRGISYDITNDCVNTNHIYRSVRKKHLSNRQ